MTSKRKLRVGLVWAQFAAYHMDRCEAVAAHLGEKADVTSIEVASASHIYSWAPSGDLRHGRKHTLFPGRAYEDVPVFTRFLALLRAVWSQDIVFFGIGYNELHILVIAGLMRLFGRKAIMMTDSKFEDMPRSAAYELGKSVALSVFHGALVAGQFQSDYMRFLGFRRRPVLTGYDTVSNARLREQAPRTVPAFAERPFVCVARMVPKKNLATLLDAFALYLGRAGDAARRLILVGDGPLESSLRARARDLGIAGHVDMPGFQDSDGVAKILARSLALVLISTEEQWGLAVNEAVALGLPAIVSDRVGARESLVANLVNGYVVSAHNVDSISLAMLQMGADEELWLCMCDQSRNMSDNGDVGKFAQSVEQMIGSIIR